MRNFCKLLAAVAMFVVAVGWSVRVHAADPYKIVNSAKVGGAGGFDYVFADSDGRRLYVPRSGGTTSRVSVYDLDTLKSVGEIPNVNGVHGVAVDPKSHHGFSSSKPVVMFDSQTLETLKTIDVQGNPDGILFDPFKQQVFVLSHRDTKCNGHQRDRWLDCRDDRFRRRPNRLPAMDKAMCTLILKIRTMLRSSMPIRSKSPRTMIWKAKAAVRRVWDSMPRTMFCLWRVTIRKRW